MKNYLEKIIEYLFYLFVFLLPLQTALILREPKLNGQIWEYGKINLYGADLLALVIFILWLLNNFSIKSLNPAELNLKKLPLYLLSLLFVSWSALSILWAEDQLLALFWTVKLAEALAIFWLILNLKINYNKLAISLIGAAFFQASLASWQFFSQSTFAFKWLGLAFHDMSQAGTSVVETSSARWLRSYGGLPHPNILGGFLMTGAALAATYYLGLLKKFTGPGINLKKLLIKVLASLIIFLVIFIGLILSFSRNAWLGLALIFLILFIYNLRQKAWTEIFGLVKLGIFSLMIASCLLFFYQNLFFSRFSGGQKLETQSFQERTVYQKQAVTLREKHWALGVGAGNYTLAVWQEINNRYPGRFYQPVHNVYLLIWSELGIVGLLIFLAIIFYSLFLILTNQGRHCDPHSASWRRAWQSRSLSRLLRDCLVSASSADPRNDKGSVSPDSGFSFSTLTYLSIFISFLIMMFFDHWLWSSSFGLLLFWLVLALALKRNS